MLFILLLVGAAPVGARSPAARPTSSAAAGQSKTGTPGALPAPPQCSATDNSKHAWLHTPTPGLPGGHPLYIRFCGPARAVVQVHGKIFEIRGGSCDDTGGYENIGIGLHAFAHAPTSSFLAFASSTAPAAFIQLPGIRYAIGQAITTGTPIRAGAVVGHFRDGTPFSGSWTCN